MKMIKAILHIIAAMAVLSSCAKEDLQLTIANQESSIDSYINSRYADSTVIRKNGSNRIVIGHGSGPDSLEFGDSLYFYYAEYVFTSSPSQLFDTNLREVAEQNNFQVTGADYSVRKIRFDRGRLVSGLENGLSGVREGEHSIIVFSAQYGFYNERLYNIPKMSALAYEVWIEKIIKN